MLKTTKQIKLILKLLFIIFVILPCELIKSFFEEETVKVRICITILTIIYIAVEVYVIHLVWKLITQVVAIWR